MSDLRRWAAWKSAGRGGVTVAWTMKDKQYFGWMEFQNTVSDATMMELTFNSCSSHSSSVQSDLHRQTNSSGHDAAYLSNQKRLSIMQ